MQHILFFDVECNSFPKFTANSTGSDLKTGRVIALAWELCTMYGETVDEYAGLIYPDGWEVPKEPFWIVNGYSTELCMERGHRIQFILPALSRYMDLAEYHICHNYKFDSRVIFAEMRRYNLMPKLDREHTPFCTMQSTKYIVGAKDKRNYIKYPQLKELYQFLFNEPMEGAHNPQYDVRATKKCFFELIKIGHFKLETENKEGKNSLVLKLF